MTIADVPPPSTVILVSLCLTICQPRHVIGNFRAVVLASGGPGSAKNDPKSAKVSRKSQKCKKLSKPANKKSDSREATFIAVVEISERKSSKTHIS